MRTDAQHVIAGNKGTPGKDKTGSQSCLLFGIGRRADPDGGSAQYVRHADIQHHLAKVLFIAPRTGRWESSCCISWPVSTGRAMQSFMPKISMTVN